MIRKNWKLPSKVIHFWNVPILIVLTGQTLKNNQATVVTLLLRLKFELNWRVPVQAIVILSAVVCLFCLLAYD